MQAEERPHRHLLCYFFIGWAPIQINEKDNPMPIASQVGIML